MPGGAGDSQSGQTSRRPDDDSRATTSPGWPENWGITICVSPKCVRSRRSWPASMALRRSVTTTTGSGAFGASAAAARGGRGVGAARSLRSACVGRTRRGPASGMANPRRTPDRADLSWRWATIDGTSRSRASGLREIAVTWRVDGKPVCWSSISPIRFPDACACCDCGARGGRHGRTWGGLPPGWRQEFGSRGAPLCPPGLDAVVAQALPPVARRFRQAPSPKSLARSVRSGGWREMPTVYRYDRVGARLRYPDVLPETRIVRA